jgi:hypothetical protein
VGAAQREARDAAEADAEAILPAGYFTNALSDKLNGTLRSPVLPQGKKNISIQVAGQRSSATSLRASGSNLKSHSCWAPICHPAAPLHPTAWKKCAMPWPAPTR